MRIISGLAKGRKLATPPSHEKSIRPTSDRAREAIFNIIGNRITGANVLDLFAGTGALGLEAFSRNAGTVIFVDNNRLALKLIQKNIRLCLKGYSGEGELRVINHNLLNGLPEKKLYRQFSRGFDIIFTDPPYSQNISHNILNSLNMSSLLVQNGLLIIEERFTVELPSQLSHLALVDKRKYGETAFWLYTPSNHPESDSYNPDFSHSCAHPSLP